MYEEGAARESRRRKSEVMFGKRDNTEGKQMEEGSAGENIWDSKIEDQ